MKEVLKRIVIDSLRELADESFQRSVWTGETEGMQSSFTEAICGLFNDSGLEVDLERSPHPPVFTPEIDEELRILESAIQHDQRILNPMPVQQMLDAPEMQSIRLQAASILNKIASD